MFFRYSLRTTEGDAARRFYSEAIGLELPEGMSEEQARARGAPPRWLGHLAVEDVDAMAERLVALGGQRLGPTVRARPSPHGPIPSAP